MCLIEWRGKKLRSQLWLRFCGWSLKTEWEWARLFAFSQLIQTTSHFIHSCNCESEIPERRKKMCHWCNVCARFMVSSCIFDGVPWWIMNGKQNRNKGAHVSKKIAANHKMTMQRKATRNIVTLNSVTAPKSAYIVTTATPRANKRNNFTDLNAIVCQFGMGE